MTLDIYEVGAAPVKNAAGHWLVHFGIYLPGITYPDGYRVRVRVIHERDQFVRGIEPKVFDLYWHGGTALDLWDITVDLTADSDGNFGQDGVYLYRFQLLRGARTVAFWFADPFARATGRGTLSAFDIGSPGGPFTWHDAGFVVPEVDDLVVYELHVGEFNGTFDGVASQLAYLQGLGVNALELMPVTNVKDDVEWGYTPLSYFAPDDRYGGPEGLKRLVDACHSNGIAVILDAVYSHSHPEFAYNLVYEHVRQAESDDGPVRGGVLPSRPAPTSPKSSPATSLWRPASTGWTNTTWTGSATTTCRASSTGPRGGATPSSSTGPTSTPGSPPATRVSTPATDGAW